MSSTERPSAILIPDASRVAADVIRATAPRLMHPPDYSSEESLSPSDNRASVLLVGVLTHLGVLPRDSCGAIVGCFTGFLFNFGASGSFALKMAHACRRTAL